MFIGFQRRNASINLTVWGPNGISSIPKVLSLIGCFSDVWNYHDSLSRGSKWQEWQISHFYWLLRAFSSYIFLEDWTRREDWIYFLYEFIRLVIDMWSLVLSIHKWKQMYQHMYKESASTLYKLKYSIYNICTDKMSTSGDYKRVTAYTGYSWTLIASGQTVKYGNHHRRHRNHH